MASWRAPDSILEAPALDFRGSGPHFPRFFGFLARKMQELISNLRVKLRCSNFKLQLPIHFPPTSKVSPDFPELPRSVQPQDAYLRSCASMSCQRWPSVHGVGGRRCPPPGGLQSAGHRRWAPRAEQQTTTSTIKHQTPS